MPGPDKTAFHRKGENAAFPVFEDASPFIDDSSKGGFLIELLAVLVSGNAEPGISDAVFGLVGYETCWHWVSSMYGGHIYFTTIQNGRFHPSASSSMKENQGKDPCRTNRDS